MKYLKARKKRQPSDEEIVDFLYSILGSLSAGLSLSQVIESLSHVPFLDRIDRIKDASMEEKINQYFSHPSLSYARAGLLYSVEMGTPVFTHIEKAIQLIKEKSALRKKKLVLTEQARLSALIVSFVPLLLMGLLGVFAPSTIKPLLTSVVGWGVILLSISLNGLAFFIMRRLMTGDE